MTKVLRFSLFCAVMVGISCTHVDTPELPPPWYNSSSSAGSPTVSSSSWYYYSSYESWNVSSSSVAGDTAGVELSSSSSAGSLTESSSSSSEVENNEVSSSSSEGSLTQSSSSVPLPSSSSIEMCGGTPISALPPGTICCNNMPQSIPGNPSPGIEYQCCGNIIQPIRTATEMCCNGGVLPIPSGILSPDVTFQCCGSDIRPIRSEQFCFDGNIIPKCGGQGGFEYDPRTEQCCGSSVCQRSSASVQSSSSAAPVVCTNTCSALLPSSSSSPKVNCAYYDAAKQFCDYRDGKIYKYVEIGTQTWMAENLRYDAAGSDCHPADSDCSKYGRYYSWATLMGFAECCNSKYCGNSVAPKHRGVCPEGWHVPSVEEWKTLINYVESAQKCSDCAGMHLKSTEVWGENKRGLDTYKFMLLPSTKPFSSCGSLGCGFYWNALDYDACVESDRAYSATFSYDDARHELIYKATPEVVRCMKD